MGFQQRVLDQQCAGRMRYAPTSNICKNARRKTTSRINTRRKSPVRSTKTSAHRKRLWPVFRKTWPKRRQKRNQSFGERLESFRCRGERQGRRPRKVSPRESGRRGPAAVSAQRRRHAKGRLVGQWSKRKDETRERTTHCPLLQRSRSGGCSLSVVGP